MTRYQQISRSVFSIDFIAIIALLVGSLFPLTKAVEMPTVFWLIHLIGYIIYGIFYFGNLYLLFPKLANKRWRFFYFIILCLSVYVTSVFFSWFRREIGFYGEMEKAYTAAGQKFYSSDHWETTVVITILLIAITFSYISAVAKKMHRNQLAFDSLERERISAELSFLKAQINPHFFFNTLHTIYALMDTDQTAAKSSIYSLSHMMRYVLYDTKNDKTSLFKEIDFIQDYIALMKVRVPADVQIIVDRQAHIQDMEIVPMLLLPFIENAFKHGISAIQPSYIFVGISMNENNMKFEVRNSLFDDLGKQLDSDAGIGIANTIRRLDLLYKGKYNLEIERDETAREHSITLTINK